jgi:ABC-type sugar transport system substrate-binding protein
MNTSTKWVGIVLACVLLASACSSSDGGGSDGDGGGSAALSSDAAAQVTDTVDAAVVPPTENMSASLGDFTPVADAHIYNITCGLQYPACNALSTEVEAAVKALGYEYTVCDTGASPEAFSTCWTKAIDDKADAIVSVAVGTNQSGDGYAAALAAGIPVIGSFTANPDDGSVSTAEVAANACGEEGRLNANAVLSDTKADSDVLLLSEQSSGCGKARFASFKEEYEKLCPDCKLATLDFDVASEQETLAPLIQGAIAKDPNLNYIVGPTDVETAIAADQITQAGKSDSIATAGADQELPMLKRMTDKDIQTFDSVYGRGEAAWTLVDAAARAIAGQDLPTSIPVNIILLTQDNVADVAGTTGWLGPKDYDAQFRAMWGLS